MRSPEMGKRPEQLDQRKIINRERGVAEKFRRNTNARIAGVVLMAITSGVFAGAFQEAMAAEKRQEVKTEQAGKEKTREEKAIDFVRKLANLPDHPNAINSDNNEYLKELLAIKLISGYAFMFAKEKDMPDSVQMTQEALIELQRAVDSFIDRDFGDNSGGMNQQEAKMEQELYKTNPGLRAIQTMWGRYSRISGREGGKAQPYEYTMPELPPYQEWLKDKNSSQR